MFCDDFVEDVDFVCCFVGFSVDYVLYYVLIWGKIFGCCCDIGVDVGGFDVELIFWLEEGIYW